MMVLILCLLGSSFAFAGGGDNKKVTKKTKADKKIQWVEMSELEEAMKKEPRMVIVDVYTQWCGWCKKMDKTTFQHKDIAKYVNEKFYAVKFDAESKKPLTIDGQKYKYINQGRRGAHELAVLLLEGRMSYPSMVILDKDMSKLTIVPGYMAPAKMDKVLRYFGDGFHAKGIHWAIFDKKFKSKIAQ